MKHVSLWPPSPSVSLYTSFHLFVLLPTTEFTEFIEYFKVIFLVISACIRRLRAMARMQAAVSIYGFARFRGHAFIA
jgi:hypothetical protein